MRSKAQAFFAGPMQIDLRDELQRLKRKAVAYRKRPDLIWHRLCSVAATTGSSVNAEAFLARYETDLRFDLLPTTAAMRTRVIFRLLEVAKVPRLREAKAQNLSENYEMVESLGGPEKATKEMLALKGKAAKQAWIRRFKGVGKKYSNDVWMDIFDPDFQDSVALDARVRAFAKALGFDVRSSKLETDLLNFAESCNLTGWELDRLIYNFSPLILRTLKNGSVGV